MKSSVPAWAVVAAVIVVLALVGFLGWKQLKPPPALDSKMPSFIDPVTRRPKGMGGGTGMPGAPKPGEASSPTGAPAAGGQ